MWQRFTERARKVVFYAQEEAQKFGEGYVSTEHLLLGLVREHDNVASRVIDKLGVSLNRVRGEVEKQLPRAEASPNQDMTLTPRAKRVIDLAYDEARSLNNDYIGTEHVLLGLIREGDGLAGRVLAKLGMELDRTRDEIRRLQGNSGAVIENEPPVPTITETLSRHQELVYEEANSRLARFLGTHDYLRSFVADPSCAAHHMLLAAHANFEEISERLAKMQRITSLNAEEPVPSPIMAQVDETAKRFKREMNHDKVSTAHYLLAMFHYERSTVSFLMWAAEVPFEHLWILAAEIGPTEK